MLVQLCFTRFACFNSGFRFHCCFGEACFVEHLNDPSVSPESLSVPMEEDGASGHANPGDDKSLPSEDASQPDEPLDARVER